MYALLINKYKQEAKG